MASSTLEEVMVKLSFVYMTAGSKAEAARIGRELVESRLAACVNILDGMNSIYRWEGEVHQDSEAVLIAKTRESLLPELVAKVESLHSNDCPCIISWPIEGGSHSYLEWMANETG